MTVQTPLGPHACVYGYMSGGISGSAVVSYTHSILNNLHDSCVFYEVNSLYDILLFSLYILISTRSISRGVAGYFSNERTLFESPENQQKPDTLHALTLYTARYFEDDSVGRACGSRPCWFPHTLTGTAAAGLFCALSTTWA
jgi:hypothetical protein